ncbi:TerC family protein [Arboricoccus pini]|nr:TerC family protein [Arboricoccus pini]
MGKPLWMWVAFMGVVAALLALDLGVLHRKDRPIEIRESVIMSGFYIAIALLYGSWVLWSLGSETGVAYFTGYFIEKSLSLDNVFVIALIFSHLGVPREYQHRVLFWGILGAIVMRGIMIFAGAALVANFAWILYVFAAFLIFTGGKMLLTKDSEPAIENNPILKFLRRRFPVTDKVDGHHFLTRLPRRGKMVTHMTPLLVALVLVELADVVFAVDSVPAIFAITQDPFVVFTSNIFAILGLRALYFALAAAIHRFRYLKPALALVLLFIGGKIIATGFVGHVPPLISLAVTLAILAGGIVWSLVKTRDEPAVTASH